MIEAFKVYFDQIKTLDVKDATEHTLRPALDHLLNALAGKKIKVIHEPKRDQAGKGAPDFKFKINECILGYLENKKIEENLDQILRSDQIAKYKQLSGNLILTNYLEWVWLKDGAILKRETLCYPSDVGYRKARLDPDKAEKVAALIAAFLSTPPKGIGRAKDLALALAIRCHELREFLTEELIRQEREHQQGKLFGLFGVFQKDVFHELDIPGFADAFAQMLGYGLFLGRLNNGNGAPISLNNAKQFIPTNFELIRELVDFLDELDKQEYREIKWLIEEILSIMNTLDLAALQEDLAFTKRQRRLFLQTEEERLLFAKDPYVYFYEGFLKAYDKHMRKSRGVYYTPPPVVNFIVRSINDILKNTFAIKDGFADRKRVTVLDFATGTGTFLLEILQQILEVAPEGLRDQLISEHALKNLYGFEYLIAPYTIAHLKLSQYLHDKGFKIKPKERLQIYLTNTLEPIEPQQNWLLPALSKEVEKAQNVKNKPILVITGNPPYRSKPLNPSYRDIRIETKSGKIRRKKIATFIGRLIESYKRVDGKPLGERNPKWLHDDYVKFIRFAQWKMDQVDEGIVGVITNHSFLDNPTFRGMRQSLMKTFNQIYVLDLHGDTETPKAPDGSKDENVFEIKKGVCISILLRKHELAQKIFYSPLWGKRMDKYRFCMNAIFNEVNWEQIHAKSPFYLFIPQDVNLQLKYEKEWQITDIFVVGGTGVITKRDGLCIKFTKDDVWRTVQDFNATSIKDAHSKFGLPKDVRDWKFEWAQDDIKKSGPQKDFVKPILYRPFDVRYTYYTGKARGFLGWPVERIMRHMLASCENIGLVSARSNKSQNMDHFFVTNYMSETKAGESTTQSCLFPLYLYNFPGEKRQNNSLFDKENLSQGKDRIENFAPPFRQFIDQKYDHHYEPEEVLGYIYAVLHSPSYRRKYAEFLKIDFPRIPFVDDRNTFEKLAALGRQLVQAHLLKNIPATLKVEVTKGSDIVEKPVYGAAQQRLYFNAEQYFAPVPEDVWNFHIGGYQVLDKYLKSRRGRELSLDEKENIMNVIKVLRFTIDRMQEIDEIWKP